MKRGTEHQPFEDDQGLLVAYYAALKIEEKNKRPEENCICQILTTGINLRRTNVDFKYNPLQFRIITQVMREHIYVRIGLPGSKSSHISIRQNNYNHIGIAIAPCVAATSCNLYNAY